MAILKPKKEEVEKAIVEKKTTTVLNVPKGTAHILIRPRISEKSAILAENNAYAFEVDPRANKAEIIKAVKYLYKVTPRMVRVVTMPQKKVFSRGKKGVKKGGKKAYIYLNKGDKIEII